MVVSLRNPYGWPRPVDAVLVRCWLVQRLGGFQRLGRAATWQISVLEVGASPYCVPVSLILIQPAST